MNKILYGNNLYGNFLYGDNLELDNNQNTDTETSLINYLPSVFQNKNNNLKILKPLDKELHALNIAAIDINRQKNIDKATWGLYYWEQDYGITYNPSLDLESRREIVKAKRRSKGNPTTTMIKNMAESFSGGEVDVIQEPDKFNFIIKFIGQKGIPKNLDAFKEQLDIIAPAHQGYNFEFVLMTWGMVDYLNISWNELENNKVTWKELQEYRVNEINEEDWDI